MGVVETAQECWDRLVRDGVLRPQDYDADLTEGLCAELRLDKEASLRAALAEVPAQVLIEHLFTVFEPLAAMIADLLRLYEAIHATRASDPNLRMTFNFDPAAAPLEVDLTAFREWEETIRRVLVSRRTWCWKQDPAWRLSRMVEQGLLGLVVDPAPVASRDREMAWPSSRDPAPLSGIDDLDRRIARAWRLREGFLAEASVRWPTRAEIWNPEVGSLGPVADDESRTMASDFWDQALGEVLTLLAARGKAALRLHGSGAGLAAAVVALSADMDSAMDELPALERYFEENVKDLTSLLSLPMWGKRHELYSAWIFTRIVDAIGEHRLSFVVEAGRFSFDFRGARLATFDSVDGPTEVWTELRTAYARPIGHGRTSAIQPDYRLVREPIAEGESSILAVEVKQYLRSALRNPAEALADYTGGLPKAHVVLAAYGPVSAQVLDGLASGARSRAHVVRFLRPGRDDELEQFRAIVAALVPPELPAPVPSTAIVCVRDPVRDGTVRVELSWELPGADLDLHAQLPDGRTVNYRNLRADTATGCVALERDIRDAPGPEVLRVSGADVVEVAVEAYSDHDLGSAGARIRIISGVVNETVPLAPTTNAASRRRRRLLVISPKRIKILERPTSSFERQAEAP